MFAVLCVSARLTWSYYLTLAVTYQEWQLTVGLAAVLVFYNVQPGTAAQLKN